MENAKRRLNWMLHIHSRRLQDIRAASAQRGYGQWVPSKTFLRSGARHWAIRLNCFVT